MVKRGERACKRGRGIAVHQHDIRLRLFKNEIQTMQRLLSNHSERLTTFHNIEIIIGLDLENIEHLIEHLPVLRGDAHNALRVLALLQRTDERRHFDGLRPGAEHRHYLDFIHPLVPFVHGGFWEV